MTIHRVFFYIFYEKSKIDRFFIYRHKSGYFTIKSAYTKSTKIVSKESINIQINDI